MLESLPYIPYDSPKGDSVQATIPDQSFYQKFAMGSRCQIFTIHTEPGKNQISNRSYLASWTIALRESPFGEL